MCKKIVPRPYAEASASHFNGNIDHNGKVLLLRV